MNSFCQSNATFTYIATEEKKSTDIKKLPLYQKAGKV